MYNDMDGFEYMQSSYACEEDKILQPKEEQIKKFCENNLCKHCFYHKHRSCKLNYSTLRTSEYLAHKLIIPTCLTLIIKPEEL